MQGVNPGWFKQELGEEAPSEHRSSLGQGGPHTAAGSCLGGAGDKRCPTSPGDRSGAMGLVALGCLSRWPRQLFGCQGYFGKVSAGKPACSWVQCPVFARLERSSLSSEAWAGSCNPCPQCLVALPPASWVLPLHPQLMALAMVLHLAWPSALSVLAGPSSVGMFQHFFPAVGICCGLGCCQPPSLPDPGRARSCTAPLLPLTPSWPHPGHLQLGGCREENVSCFFGSSRT